MYLMCNFMEIFICVVEDLDVSGAETETFQYSKVNTMVVNA